MFSLTEMYAVVFRFRNSILGMTPDAVSRKVYWFAPGSLLYVLQSLQVNIPYIDLKGMIGKQIKYAIIAEISKSYSYSSIIIFNQKIQECR